MVFADDIAIVTDSRISLSKSIDMVGSWCKNNKMEVNKRKSKILFMKGKWTRNKKSNTIPIKIKGIDVVKQAKYLGIMIDNKLLFVK
jgi:hypothetical protein